MIYLFVFVVPFLIVYLSIPNIRYVALKFSIVDKKNYRKIHNKLVTKLGGLGIYFGFLGGLIIVSIFDTGFLITHITQISGFVICSILMLLLGIYDDFYGSDARTKLVTQVIISLLLIKLGFRLERIFIPNLLDINFGIFSTLTTLLWLVGITNAINLIDGLDGLAAGIMSVVYFFFCLYGIFIRENFIIFVSLSLLGANLAFLRYNFYPAKIFMGDTGSLFLGFIVGSLAIFRTNAFQPNNILFVPSVFLLLLPILDTIFAIVRRILRQQHIFSSDFSHLHHYYIKLGFTQAQTVKRFCMMTFCLGICSLILLYFKK